MKTLQYCLLFILSSCAFSKTNVKYNSEKFTRIADYMIKNNIKNKATEQISDLQIQKQMKNLGIDLVNVGNYNQLPYEPQDSVVVFLKHGAYMFGKRRRVLYDYSKEEQLFPDTTINGYRKYVLKRVKKRIYLTKEETGN